LAHFSQPAGQVTMVSQFCHPPAVAVAVESGAVVTVPSSAKAEAARREREAMKDVVTFIL